MKYYYEHDCSSNLEGPFDTTMELSRNLYQKFPEGNVLVTVYMLEPTLLILKRYAHVKIVNKIEKWSS